MPSAPIPESDFKTLKPPVPSKSDVAHSLARAGLAALPIVGGPAVELFNMVVTPPIDRRRTEWMHDVGEKLQELEVRSFDLRGLRENPQFISAVMHASTVAIETHERGKLEALRNAVLNVAQGQLPDEARQHFFLECIRSFSEMHLRILKLFRNPPGPGFPTADRGNFEQVLEHGIPDLVGQAYFYNQLWRDLYSRGLVSIERLSSGMSWQGLTEKRTTDLGDMFLRFISEGPPSPTQVS